MTSPADPSITEAELPDPAEVLGQHARAGTEWIRVPDAIAALSAAGFDIVRRPPPGEGLAEEEQARLDSFRRMVERPVLTTDPGHVPVVALPASEAADLIAIIDRLLALAPPPPGEPGQPGLSEEERQVVDEVRPIVELWADQPSGGTARSYAIADRSPRLLAIIDRLVPSTPTDPEEAEHG